MVGTVSSSPFLPLQTAPQRDADPAKARAADAEGPPARAHAVQVDLATGLTDIRLERLEAAAARSALDLAIGAGSEARGFLAEAATIAQRAAQADVPDAARGAQDIAFRSALQRFGQVIDAAVANGASLLAGGSTKSGVEGVDLRLTDLGARDGLALTTASSVATAANAGAALADARASLSALDAGLSRFTAAGARLEGHESVLAAADSALKSGVRTDLDAEGARLLALQVRQGLAALDGPISSSSATGILAHFRE